MRHNAPAFQPRTDNTQPHAAASVTPAIPALHAAKPAPLAAATAMPVQSESDREKQAEELEVLRSIYSDGTELRVLPPPSPSPSSDASGACTLELELTLGAGLVVVVRLPLDYPSERAPMVDLRFSDEWSFEDGGSAHPTSVAALLAEMAAELYDTTVAPAEREVVLFQYAEFLRARLVEPEELRRKQVAVAAAAKRAEEEARALRAAEADAAAEAAQRISAFDDADGELDSAAAPSASASAPVPAAAPIAILSGPPFTDRKSTFQAHAARVTSPAQAAQVLAQLMSVAKIARATHNIWAFAIRDPSSGVWRRDCDDDGESEAGARLAHLLRMMGVEDVVVVVTRWYGGVLLGPDRFRHINNVARAAVEELQLQQQQQQQTAAQGQENGGAGTGTKGHKKAAKQHAHKR